MSVSGVAGSHETTATNQYDDGLTLPDLRKQPLVPAPAHPGKVTLKAAPSPPSPAACEDCGLIVWSHAAVTPPDVSVNPVPVSGGSYGDIVFRGLGSHTHHRGYKG